MKSLIRMSRPVRILCSIGFAVACFVLIVAFFATPNLKNSIPKTNGVIIDPGTTNLEQSERIKNAILRTDDAITNSGITNLEGGRVLKNTSFRTDVVITDSGTTNLDGRRLRLFALLNRGSARVRRDYFYTIYWTNAAGAPEYSFGKYSSSKVIEVGETEIVGVVPPTCNGKWYATFAFRVEPSKTFLFMQKSPILRNLISSNSIEKFKDLHVFMGPDIDGADATNRVLSPAHW